MQEALSYRVVLTGELVEGHEPEAVAAALAQLFKKPPEQVRRLFRGKPHPLNREFDYAKANALRKRIQAAGAHCLVEPVVQQDWGLEPMAEPATAAAPSAPPGDSPGLTLAPGPEAEPAAAREAGGVTCPKCGHRQAGGETCEACRIVFAKYRPRVEAHPVEQPARLRRPEAADDEAALWDDLLRFVGPNADLYAAKFRQFGDLDAPRPAITWHWPAFLVPALWALYRKQWVFAAGIWLMGLFVFYLPPLTWLLVNIGCGLFANYLYFRDALGKVRNIHRTLPPDSRPARIAQLGGPSSTAVWVGMAASVLLSLVTWQLMMAPMLEQMGEAQRISRGDGDEALSEARLDTPQDRAAALQLGMLSLAVKLAVIQQGGLDDTDWERITARMRMGPEDLQDPWGTPLRFEPDYDAFVLRSAGADRAFDTQDDLSQRTPM